jgi:hypothetical protein
VAVLKRESCGRVIEGDLAPARLDVARRAAAVALRARGLSVVGVAVAVDATGVGGREQGRGLRRRRLVAGVASHGDVGAA